MNEKQAKNYINELVCTQSPTVYIIIPTVISYLVKKILLKCINVVL